MKISYIVRLTEKPLFLCYSEAGPVFKLIAEKKYLYHFDDKGRAVEFMTQHFLGVHFIVIKDYYIPDNGRISA